MGVNTLKILRSQRKWSIRELARRSDVSPSLISMIERRSRRLTDRTARQLAAALGVRWQRLCT